MKSIRYSSECGTDVRVEEEWEGEGVGGGVRRRAGGDSSLLGWDAFQRLRLCA